jgi:hypothetical protein
MAIFVQWKVAVACGLLGAGRLERGDSRSTASENLN